MLGSLISFATHPCSCPASTCGEPKMCRAAETAVVRGTGTAANKTVGCYSLLIIDDYDCHTQCVSWTRAPSLGCLGLCLSRSRDRPSGVEQPEGCVFQRLTRLAKPDIRLGSVLILHKSCATRLVNANRRSQYNLQSAADCQVEPGIPCLFPHLQHRQSPTRRRLPKRRQFDPKQNTPQQTTRQLEDMQSKHVMTDALQTNW
jgi:hypothetical protein